MDLAITRVVRSRRVPFDAEAAPDERWDVVCLHQRCGSEVAQPLASFGHRFHAEAFLSDLLAGRRAEGSADGYRSA
jgi:hypothetical protein